MCRLVHFCSAPAVHFYSAIDSYYLDWENWIPVAYDFYKDKLKTIGKQLPATSSTLDKFLSQYIRSRKQLDNLIWHAHEHLTEQGDHWLEETYPDDYLFEHLPTIIDDSRFRMLRTAGQLRELAKKLRNCAAGYLHDAAKGVVIFFAYEYSPENNLHPLPQDPEHAVDGLLALRGDRLNHWLQTGTAPDWAVIQQKLVAEFKGFRNEELGQHAWDDLESFFLFQIAPLVAVGNSTDQPPK